MYMNWRNYLESIEFIMRRELKNFTTDKIVRPEVYARLLLPLHQRTTFFWYGPIRAQNLISIFTKTFPSLDRRRP